MPLLGAMLGAIHGCLCYAISNLPVVPQIYSLVDVYLDMFSFAAGIVLGLFGLNRALELWASVRRKKRGRAC